jgi:hypothetical protein
MDTHRETDSLHNDAQHLQNICKGELTGDRLELAISVAKRVRRTSSILLKRLASERDQQTQPGG